MIKSTENYNKKKIYNIGEIEAITVKMSLKRKKQLKKKKQIVRKYSISIRRNFADFTSTNKNFLYEHFF